MSNEQPKAPEESKEKRPLPYLTDDELRTFVSDFASNQIFSSAHVPEAEADLLRMIFMPIAFGAFDMYPEEDLKDIGLIYEYMNAQGPRSINGYPMFWSCKLMRKGDWERARGAIIIEIERRKTIELPQRAESEMK